MKLSNALIFIAGFLLFAQIGVSMGYHRYLAHKSFKPKRWFEILMVILGLPSGTPVQWAGNHRAHHQHTDTPEDPHSPHQRGFWYAHNGWYLQTNRTWVCVLYAFAGFFRSFFDAFYRPRTNQQYNYLAKDISTDPFLNFLSKPAPYAFFVIAYTLITIGIAIAMMGPFGIFIAWLCYVWVYNIGDAIDSFGHLYGDRPFKTGTSLATNSFVLALITFGDGWHSNHHAYPKSPRHGLKPNEIDTSYYLLCVLNKARIVKW